MWQAWVLLPAAALLLYFAAHSRSAAITELPPWLRAVFFGGCAAICLAVTGLVFWRYLRPVTELVLTRDGITSKLFWGPGSLSWNRIEMLKVQGNWLFVHGKDEQGRKRKLIVNLTGLDVPRDVIMGTIEHFRPDLFSAHHT